ncbi:MAG: hypothetical protein LBS59_00930, partial [Puniceicoccales bacterium]|nr:hypothetical protein [Puniceicoccales bacterium]
MSSGWTLERAAISIATTACAWRGKDHRTTKRNCAGGMENSQTGETCSATAAAPLRRASLHTLGCRLNQTETALLRDRLTRAGYTI